ncbi:MAG: hypothetical protein Q9160_001289 [Pyrenula sp. 1 TL-2023]
MLVHVLSALAWASLLLPVKFAWAASAEQWRDRTIYQVLTDRFALPQGAKATCNDLTVYCGGKYSALIDQLDYIQGMGFTALWISPIVENRDTPQAYHGYWPQDPNKLNLNYGTDQDLRNLISAVHDRGMYLMVDFVINHFSVATEPKLADYSKFPPPWNSANAFHGACDINYKNQTSVEDCWVSTSNYGSLPDVYTELPQIFNPMVDSVSNLVKTYGFDGIRLDTAKHVPKSYLQQFQTAVNTFVIGEVADGRYDYVGGYTNSLNSVLNYGLFYNAQDVFTNSASFDNLGYGVYQAGLNSRDPTLLGTFLDNHDQPRLASHPGDDMVQDMNAVTFLMFNVGIPIIYYGFEHRFTGGEDPKNREMMWMSNYNTGAPLYQYIAKLHNIRTLAADVSGAQYYTQANWLRTTATNFMSFERGKLVIVVNNFGQSKQAQPSQINKSQYRQGDKLADLLSCDTVTVQAQDGSFTSPPAKGNAARIWIAVANAGDFCPQLASSTSSSVGSVTGTVTASYSSTISATISVSSSMSVSVSSTASASASVSGTTVVTTPTSASTSNSPSTLPSTYSTSSPSPRPSSTPSFTSTFTPTRSPSVATLTPRSLTTPSLSSASPPPSSSSNPSLLSENTIVTTLSTLSTASTLPSLSSQSTQSPLPTLSTTSTPSSNSNTTDTTFSTVPIPSTTSCPPPQYTCFECNEGTTRCSLIATARQDL